MRELEAELEAEQRRARDLAAEVRKLQRLLQEQKQQTDDERRLAAEANEQINQLQARIKTLKRQLEEAVRHCVTTLDSASCLTSATLPPPRFVSWSYSVVFQTLYGAT